MNAQQAEAMKKLGAMDPETLATMAEIGRSLGMQPSGPGTGVEGPPPSPPRQVPVKVQTQLFAQRVADQESADELTERVNAYLTSTDGLVEMWREWHDGVLVIGINRAVPGGTEESSG